MTHGQERSFLDGLFHLSHLAKSWLRFCVWNRPLVFVRIVMETWQYWFPPPTPSDPDRLRVIYMTGVPRTGSSLLKNYVGDGPGLTILKFQQTGFFRAWREAQTTDDIIIDKATHYIWNLYRIHRTYGDSVGFCCIIRDPRDILLSLLDSGLHLEIPRGPRFWDVWYAAYEGFLRFCSECRPRRVYLLRYEDLARYPVEVKSHFFAWLGLGLPEVTAKYRIAHQDDDQDFKVSTRQEIVTLSVEQHQRQDIAPQTIELLESLAEYPRVIALMERLGYELDGVRDHVETFPDLQIFAPDTTDQHRQTER